MAKTFNKLNPLNSQDDEEKPELDQSRGLGEQAMERMIGKIDIPDDERQVAKPINLDMIMPDPTQPRREVPAVVRNRAREQGLPEWEMWHQMAERQAGHTIPLKALLRGEGDGPEDERTGKPLFDGFMALVALAASIYEKGLINPITVSARGAGYMIETGERRYQAYRLLHGVLGHKKFSRITANVVPHVDVWRQAAENNNRKPLTAIGMARQLALLIMALTGKEYRPYEDFSADREFYAQVADGSAHRIPSGMAERILQATGLKSKSQLANYRALLDVSNALWMLADEEEWTENRIREHVLNLKNPERFTPVNLSPSDPFGTQPPMSIKKGEGPGTLATGVRMLYFGKEVEYVDATARKDKSGLDVLINHIDANGLRTTSETVHSRDLFDLPSPDQGKPTGSVSPTPFVAPKVKYDVVGANTVTTLEVGQWRKALSGRVLEILSITASEVSVIEISPSTGKPISTPFRMNIIAATNMPLASKGVLPQITVHDDTDKTPEQAVDNPSSTTTDESPELPEWAITGQIISHALTGAIATILGTAWDEHTEQWFVRVQYGPGEWEDLPVVECHPTDQRPQDAPAQAPEPRPRHPGMDPKNLMSLITGEQSKLGALWNMATDLKMQTEASQITRLKTLTPNSVATFLRNDGYEGAQARIAAMFEAASGTLTEMWNTVQTIHTEANELLRQMADEQQAS